MKPEFDALPMFYYSDFSEVYAELEIRTGLPLLTEPNVRGIDAWDRGLDALPEVIGSLIAEGRPFYSAPEPRDISPLKEMFRQTAGAKGVRHPDFTEPMEMFRRMVCRHLTTPQIVIIRGYDLDL